MLYIYIFKQYFLSLIVCSAPGLPGLHYMRWQVIASTNDLVRWPCRIMKIFCFGSKVQSWKYKMYFPVFCQWQLLFCVVSIRTWYILKTLRPPTPSTPNVIITYWTAHLLTMWWLWLVTKCIIYGYNVMFICRLHHVSNTLAWIDKHSGCICGNLGDNFDRPEYASKSKRHRVNRGSALGKIKFILRCICTTPVKILAGT
jgi:hypothetical protein